MGQTKMKTPVTVFLLMLPILGCARNIQTAPISAPLPVAQAPSYGAGDTWVWQDREGVQFTNQIDRVDGELLIGSSTLNPGCSISIVQNTIAPEREISSCGDDNTKQEIETEGALFPLSVGNAESWNVTRTNATGQVNRYSAGCTVNDTARVTVPAGTFDTYVINCSLGRERRNYFFAPEIGTVVMYLRQSGSRGSVRRDQLVSFSRG